MATYCPPTRSATAPAAVNQSRTSSDRSKPKLREMLEELEQVTNWQLLMLKLDMEKHNTDKIELNHPNNIDRQKQDAFDLWLRQTPNGRWKDIIDALNEMDENTIADKLTKKYAWKDPREQVYVTQSYFSAANRACITAQPIGDVPCRKYLPQLKPCLQYYTLEDDSPAPYMTSWQAQKTTEHFTRLIRKRHEKASNIFEFFESMETSDRKEDFKVGLEARFGKVYWKIDPHKVLRSGSSRQEWSKSRLINKCAFNTEVERADVRQLIEGREQLGDTMTKINLNFLIMEGLDEEIYRARVANYDSEETFYLDAVYREPKIEARARINTALPGRKYDFRIADCSDCVVLESESSIPYKIATTITKSMTRLDGRKLHLILRGETRGKLWKVKYIRQRVQTQYSWKPERKWILAHYDVNVFQRDHKAGLLPDVDDAPLNKPVELPKFDYSRIEIELWGQKVFPKDVNKSELSKNKYYYPESVAGVKLPGGEERPAYKWTTKDLIMNDFDEFWGDAFKIAHILSGCPY